jgi:hypothetical protein
MRHLLFSTLVLGFLLGVFVLADRMFCVSLATNWTVGFLLVGLGLGYAGSRGAARVPRTVLLSLFALATVAMPWVEWDSLKPFIRDLYSIEPGMDRQQVDAIMGKYMKGTGFPANPYSPSGGTLQEASSGSTYATKTGPDGQLELVDAIVYRHTDNADWGIVRFREGRVVTVEFSPD